MTPEQRKLLNQAVTPVLGLLLAAAGLAIAAAVTELALPLLLIGGCGLLAVSCLHRFTPKP
jgi:hypothetical protein